MALLPMLKFHCCLSNWYDVTADVDPVLPPVTENVNVQNTSPPHFCPLFADKTRTSCTRYKTMANHECGKRAC